MLENLFGTSAKVRGRLFAHKESESSAPDTLDETLPIYKIYKIYNRRQPAWEWQVGVNLL